MKDTPAMRYGAKDCFPNDLQIGLGRGIVCHTPGRACEEAVDPHGDLAFIILDSREGFGLPLRLSPNLIGSTYGVSPMYLTFSTIVVTTQDNQP